MRSQVCGLWFVVPAKTLGPARKMELGRPGTVSWREVTGSGIELEITLRTEAAPYSGLWTDAMTVVGPARPEPNADTAT